MNVEYREEAKPTPEIVNEADRIVAIVEMPGAEREDVHVDLTPYRVRIVALPRKEPSPVYVEFERIVPLPCRVDPEAAEARINNGVLEVVMPKAVEPRVESDAGSDVEDDLGSDVGADPGPEI